MTAVIETGGKQYVVEPGRQVTIEKLDGAQGNTVVFDRVLFVTDEQGTAVGTPVLSSARVTGEILSQGRAPKVHIIKFKAKVRYRRHTSHRQQQTVVKITGITK